MSIQESEIPKDVQRLRVQDLAELSENQEVLNGLWEKSQSRSDIFDELCKQSTENQEAAARIKSELAAINDLHAQARELDSKEADLSEKWRSAESEMHAKIQPYSRVAISALVKSQMDNLAASIKTMEEKMLDPERKNEDAVVFAKRYVQSKQQMYFLQHLLEKI